VVLNRIAPTPRTIHGRLESARLAAENALCAQVRLEHRKSCFGPRLEVFADLLRVVRAHRRLAVHADLVAVLSPQHLMHRHALRLTGDTPAPLFHRGTAAPLPPLPAKLLDLAENFFDVTRILAEDPALQHESVWGHAAVIHLAVT